MFVELLQVEQLHAFRRCGWCVDGLAAAVAVVVVDDVAGFGNALAVADAAVDDVDVPNVLLL